MSLVNISIVGNLVKPPEQFCFSSGNVKTTLVVAVDSPSRKQDGTKQTEFYRVETWGKLAEVAHKYLAKGNQVAATGRLVINRWQDREGKERVTPTVEASQIALPPKSRDDSKPINPITGQMSYDDCASVPATVQQPAASAASQSAPASSESVSASVSEDASTDNEDAWLQAAPPVDLASQARG